MALVMGIDAGTESVRVCLFTLQGHEVATYAVEYPTSFPHNGWAEQHPEEWWISMGACVRTVLDMANCKKENVCALAIDATCCSVVSLGKNGFVLRPCLLWMDTRAAGCAVDIMTLAEGDEALDINCGGKGPLSAEWMIPKALWMKRNEPEIWSRSEVICEKLDYINYRCTGRMCASACNVAARWHFDARAAVTARTGDCKYPGRPLSLLEKIDLLDILEKWPEDVVSVGDRIGSLTAAAAEHLGLSEDTVVVQGGPDAYIGMVGLGCIEPGQVALITGSSHLHLCVHDTSDGTDGDVGRMGVWGLYRGAVTNEISFSEGGQSSTGSTLSWARKLLSGADRYSYSDLDNEAKDIPPGADGLLVLETFQGSRTPLTDSCQRGAIVGLSLSHSRAHLWRALLEGVCFGTRACFESLIAPECAGLPCVLVTGGATRSNFWLQMHADVVGAPVQVNEGSNAPLLGCAIVAMVGMLKGTDHEITLHEAVKRMVRKAKVIHPDMDMHEIYNRIYKKYQQLSPALRSVFHFDS
mmetsp:Transcript_1201/g.1956  ORF Transcript_1201/g.1956 Transcript_1201/m.1956 type:complete len:526 (-) Transcript_1201:280-1857(-)|eukprot:CAMPEP_0185037288 /NCGR_PEP_ID=MMETSP1103-20130426/31454_1 /TAXON_ID=36769 /ORGANISM="Paraphysomonas bandaiensis, Strain Caron Lab Isolate" /LENGTH=525 /DNA_ID=CAMNT_0027575195 /DNA_START=46 /DNA_END=1623 /DNA_ORIENTATION=-